MINEANKVLAHDEAVKTVADAWRRAQYGIVLTEFTLPNGKRADVIAFTGTQFYLAEVKLDLRQSLIEEALNKYGRYTNYLYSAVPAIGTVLVERRVPIVGMPQPWQRVGILGVYPDTITCLRSPAYRQISRLDYGQLVAAVHAAVRR